MQKSIYNAGQHNRVCVLCISPQLGVHVFQMFGWSYLAKIQELKVVRRFRFFFCMSLFLPFFFPLPVVWRRYVHTYHMSFSLITMENRDARSHTPYCSRKDHHESSSTTTTHPPLLVSPSQTKPHQ